MKAQMEFILLVCIGLYSAGTGAASIKKRTRESNDIYSLLKEVDNGVEQDRCQILVDSFMPFRDAAVEFVDAYPDLTPYVQLIEMTLNFPVTSDSHWNTLWCRVAEAKNFRQIAEALRIRVPPRQLFQMAEHFKQIIYELEDVLPDYIHHNTELAAWMNKTGFPDQWPVSHTDKMEVIHLMELHDLSERKNPLLLGADPTDLTNPQIADTLLESGSLKEYLTQLGSEWLLEPRGPLSTNIDWLHFMKSEGQMNVYYTALWRLFDFTRTLESQGVLALVK